MTLRTAPFFLALAVSGAMAAPVLAADPNLTGMWVKEAKGADAPTDAFGDGRPNIPYTAEAKAAAARDRAITSKAGLLTSSGHTKCLPPGMPSMMQPPFGLEFLQTPGRITILAEVSNMPRTIYMDAKSHPDNLDPGWNGHSIGHWEKDVLVIDTVAFNGRSLNVSDQMHMVEHIHLEAGGKTLVDAITMTDPKTYTAPYTLTYRYTRLGKDEPLMEYFCEVEPEALDALTAAEKAADSAPKQAAK
jgi:hypothetical protein